ncbi:MAG: VOC family protein [Pseudomonadota bacterium]
MTYHPEHFTVWAEIPVTDLDKATAFYEAVFETELKRNDMGPNPIVDFQTKGGMGVAGHLYPGVPAARGSGPTVHLSVQGLEAAIERVKAAGGTVVSPPIEIPPGRFAYCEDLDGNSLGLFEAK